MLEHDSAAQSAGWLPEWVDANQLESVHATGLGDFSFSLERPRLEAWPDVASGLRRAGGVLRRLSIADIVDAVGQAAERWCDREWPARRAARDAAAAATGLSTESVERSFDVELRNYRSESLWTALRHEMGDPLVLDDLRPDVELGGLTTATGPDLTAVVFTGNVPGLPALSLVRALLVKSPVIAKTASGEPTFAARFVETLAEVDPRLGDAVVVTYWHRDESDVRTAVIREADAVIAYGGDASCEAVRAAVAPEQRYIEHGHRLSLGLLSRAYLDEQALSAVAEDIARDVSMFDQHACIAPQAYLMEGAASDAHALGDAIAVALRDYADACPLGELDLVGSAELQLRRAAASFRAANSSSGRIWSAPDWTIVVDDRLPEAAGGGQRVLTLVPVADLEGAVEELKVIGRLLQNVALGARPDECGPLARRLAHIGATRLCAPGRMAEPSLTWRHDGRPCIADLVRWCDLEMHPLAGARPGLAKGELNAQRDAHDSSTRGSHRLHAA